MIARIYPIFMFLRLLLISWSDSKYKCFYILLPARSDQNNNYVSVFFLLSLFPNNRGKQYRTYL